MGRPRKPLISKRKTLEVALKIVDEEGLEALSIRRLGRELNVQGISLYHHFENKEDILIGVCELALESVRTPQLKDMNWRDWMLRNAEAYRKALLDHPNLMPVLIRRGALSIGLAEHNATVGLLAVQGVPPEAVLPLTEGLEQLALGSALFESSKAGPNVVEGWSQRFPYLYHATKMSVLSGEELFDLMARAAIEALVRRYAIGTSDTTTATKRKA